MLRQLSILLCHAPLLTPVLLLAGNVLAFRRDDLPFKGRSGQQPAGRCQ